MNFEEALGIVRRFIDVKIPKEDAINNPAIPVEFRSRILEELNRESTITLEPTGLLIPESPLKTG